MRMNSLKKNSRNPTTFNEILVFSARKFLVKKILFFLNNRTFGRADFSVCSGFKKTDCSYFWLLVTRFVNTDCRCSRSCSVPVAETDCSFAKNDIPSIRNTVAENNHFFEKYSGKKLFFEWQHNKIILHFSPK